MINWKLLTNTIAQYLYLYPRLKMSTPWTWLYIDINIYIDFFYAEIAYRLLVAVHSARQPDRQTAKALDLAYFLFLWPKQQTSVTVGSKCPIRKRFLSVLPWQVRCILFQENCEFFTRNKLAPLAKISFEMQFMLWKLRRSIL